MYVQKCLHGEYYCAPYDIYDNIDETITILAHSTDTRSLYDYAPSLKDNPLVKTDNKFDDWLLEDTRRMVHQGILDNCDDFFLSVANLE